MCMRARKGEGAAQDEAEALRWWRLAANQGHADAQTRLGMCYLHGLGVARDLEQAALWLKQAAQQGDEQGNCRLYTSPSPPDSQKARMRSSGLKKKKK